MLEADGGKGKSCKCTKLKLSPPILPGHLLKQLKLITPGIKKGGGELWGAGARLWVYFGPLPTSSRTNAAHSTALTSRQTPPSMAKHCPGTVPGGNLDMCVCRPKGRRDTQALRNVSKGRNLKGPHRVGKTDAYILMTVQILHAKITLGMRNCVAAF